MDFSSESESDEQKIKPSGYGQTAELHALMAHGASMGISRGVTSLLDELTEVQPTLLYAVPQLFKRVCDAIHAKVRAGTCQNGLKVFFKSAREKNDF